MPREKGRIDGGFYNRSEGRSQTPVLVLDVPNLDTHLQEIEEAGGVVVTPRSK